MTENMSLQACTRYARVLDTHHYVEQLLKRLNVQRVNEDEAFELEHQSHYVGEELCTMDLVQCIWKSKSFSWL